MSVDFNVYTLRDRNGDSSLLILCFGFTSFAESTASSETTAIKTP